MPTQEQLVEEARAALVKKFGSLWHAAYAYGPDQGLTGATLLLGMRKQPVPKLIAMFVEEHTTINLSSPLCTAGKA